MFCLGLLSDGGEIMEAQTVFGGTSSLSSSLARSSTRRACSLSYPHTPLLRTSHHLHLAAFHPKSHLFSYFPSRPHAKTLSHTTKPHIFLPHLVASMVFFPPFCFSYFYLKLLRPRWLSYHFLFAKFIRTPIAFDNSNSIFFGVRHHFVQEQVEETYIMVKPDGVQRGLVSFTLIWLQFLESYLMFGCWGSIGKCLAFYNISETVTLEDINLWYIEALSLIACVGKGKFIIFGGTLYLEILSCQVGLSFYGA